jgi:hypothetical protein
VTEHAIPATAALPAWFMPSVYLHWPQDWRREAVAVATRSPEHAMPADPDGPQRGDVVVTVLGDSGVVAAVERMIGSDGEAWASDDLYSPEVPVVWADLFEGADAYTGTSGWLPPEHARAVLDGVAVQVASGPIHTFDPGDCSAHAMQSDVHALRLLGHRHVTGWAMRREERCASCERFVDVRAMRPHDDGAHRLGSTSAAGRTLDQLVRDVHLLCEECHQLLHAHSVAFQRARMRPQCPGCGARGSAKRIVWGMTFTESRVGAEPDVVYGGFEVPVPTPEWYCTECHANFTSTVVASRARGATGAGAAGEPAGEPAREPRRDAGAELERFDAPTDGVDEAPRWSPEGI